MRNAIDACLRAPEHYSASPQWMDELDSVSEGSSTTLGAYHRPWQ